MPAHSPPIHRFGVASFAGAFAADPLIWCCFVCRRICRRSTDLVLLHLPAHSSPSRHQFGVVSLGRRIPCRFGHFVCRRIRRQPTDLVSLFLAGASPRRATIALFGRRIPSPCHNRSFWPAHPLAAPPSLFFAGASPCRAPIAYLRWGIPSPCLHRLSRSAHPIASPPYRISAGASHRRTSIAYLGLRAHSMPHCTKKYQSRDIPHASASAASILM